MKRLTLLAAAFLCPSFLFAEMKPLEGLGSISNAFIVKGRADEVALEAGESPTIRFTPSAGESTVLVFGQGKEATEVDLKELTVDFLVHGYGSFGIYGQGMGTEAAPDGYLVLANTEKRNEGQLRIIKNGIWPQTYPTPEEIKSKQAIRNYRPDVWYRLAIVVEPKEGEEVLVTARITDIEDGSKVSEIQYLDDHGLRGIGQMALRLFAEKKSESFVEFRNVVVTPRE